MAWRWSLFSFALIGFQGSRFFLMLPGTLVGFRTGWILLRQYWWALFSQIPFKLMVQCRPLVFKLAFKHQLPCSWYQRWLLLWVGSGSISAKMKDDWNRPLLLGVPQEGLSSSQWGRSRYSNMEGVSWHKTIFSPTLAARLQTVTIPSCEVTGASRRKLTKAKSIYSRQNTKLQRNLAVVYLSSLCWQRVHYTPISMKSRLIMIKYIVRRSPFYPEIFSGVSPSVRLAGHLSKSHLSGPHQGGPPARSAGGHFIPSVHRCPEGHAAMSEHGVGGWSGWAVLRTTVRGKLRLARPAFLLQVSWLGRMIIIHLISTICCWMILQYEKLWYLLRKSLLILLGHFLFWDFFLIFECLKKIFFWLFLSLFLDYCRFFVSLFC